MKTQKIKKILQVLVIAFLIFSAILPVVVELQGYDPPVWLAVPLVVGVILDFVIALFFLFAVATGFSALITYAWNWIFNIEEL